MKDSDLTDLGQERALNEQIAALSNEEVMHNDVWPSVKRVISRPETKFYTARWIPWAIAASLVVSLGSLSVSWNNLQQAKSLYAQAEQSNLEQQDVDELAHLRSMYEQSLDYQVSLMEQEFKVAKVGLVSRISMNRAHIDEKLFEEIEKQLTEIEKATQLLKLAIRSQPANSNLPRLLRATYQQELAVLTQLAKLDTSI